MTQPYGFTHHQSICLIVSCNALAKLPGLADTYENEKDTRFSGWFRAWRWQEEVYRVSVRVQVRIRVRLMVRVVTGEGAVSTRLETWVI